MARWRTLGPVQFDSVRVRAGDVFDFDGPPNFDMVPLDAAAEALKVASIDLGFVRAPAVPGLTANTWAPVQNRSMVLRLARSLGWTSGTYESAKVHIETWHAAHV